VTDHWYPAYIGLGSNLGNPALQLETAFGLLSEIPWTRLIRRSSLYRSEPFGGVEQPDFVNAAAALITQLSAGELLRELQNIENKCGRERGDVQWGPRTLDLDLLVYSDHEIDETDLIVPHPGISERNFVLLPLGELAPELHVPNLGRIASLDTHISDLAVSRIK